jgi:hypothetical protein
LNWYFFTWINLLFFVCNNSVGLMVVKNWKLNIISCLTFLIFASNLFYNFSLKTAGSDISFSSINFFYKIWRQNFKNRNTVLYPHTSAMVFLLHILGASWWMFNGKACEGCTKKKGDLLLVIYIFCLCDTFN